MLIHSLQRSTATTVLLMVLGVLAAAQPREPADRLDGALIVNAYHEFAEHSSMLRHVRAALKPGGRLVLVEPIARAEDTVRAAQTRRHTIAIELVENELKEAGFEISPKRSTGLIDAARAARRSRALTRAKTSSTPNGLVT